MNPTNLATPKKKIKIKNPAKIATAIEMAWDQESAALFAAVMSFWFGGRAINKYLNR